MNTGSTAEPVMPDDSPTRRESGEEPQTGTSSSEQDDSESEWIPKGPTHSLNSKRVKAEQL